MTPDVASQKHENAQDKKKTLDTIQRWAPMVGGAALAILGLSRRSKSGLAVAAAGGLVAYIATNTNANSLIDQVVGSAEVVVSASPEELYRFWSDLERSPQFMRHLQSVSVQDGRSHWVVLDPLGARIEWDAEITSQRENASIAWRSVDDSELDLTSEVEFRPLSHDRGTLVTTRMRCCPGSKALGLQFAKLLGKDPSFFLKQDLRRFKALVETGEIPTTEGQSHGPRSLAIAAARVLDPNAVIPKNSSLKETLERERRAS
jgi:uncharacterized membrane protein